MEKIINELKVWLDGLKDSSLPQFDNLPDVSLYMDQIVSYIDTILAPYSRDEQKLITSFMVNNYVKAKIIEAPVLKREYFNDENGDFYNHFINIHNATKTTIHSKMVENLERAEKGEKVTSRVRRKKETEETTPEINVKKNLIDLSLKLMIESEINKMVAERILYELGKDAYNDPKLFEQKNTEIKFDNLKNKFETKRIKKVKVSNVKKLNN